MNSTRPSLPPVCVSQGLPPWGDQPPTDADISSFILDPALHKAFSGVPSDEHEISCAPTTWRYG